MIGLTELKAQVYLYVLHYGPCSAARVYRGLEHDKSSTYRILDELVREGLLEKKGGKYGQEYRATDPSFVLQLARDRREEISEAEREIFDLVRNLEEQSALVYKQHNVRVYEGVRGAKDIWEEQLLGQEKIVREIGTTSILAPFLEDYRDFMQRHAQKRVAAKVFLRSLVSWQDWDDLIDVSSRELMREVRFLPRGFTLQVAMLVFGERVAFHYPKGKKLRGVVLLDGMIAGLVKGLFDQIWQVAGETRSSL